MRSLTNKVVQQQFQLNKWITKVIERDIKRPARLHKRLIATGRFKKHER